MALNRFPFETFLHKPRHPAVDAASVFVGVSATVIEHLVPEEVAGEVPPTGDRTRGNAVEGKDIDIGAADILAVGLLDDGGACILDFAVGQGVVLVLFCRYKLQMIGQELTPLF